MNRNLNVYLLDNQNNIIVEQIIEKPLTYEDLLNSIREKIIEMPESFKIFYHNNDNNIKFIENNDDYKLIYDLIFIVDSNNNNLVFDQSFYPMIYDQLSESKQEIYDNKYNCFICKTHINNQNPYFCYICQNIYHTHCLRDWENQRNDQNSTLNCPNCRNELPLRYWRPKLNFEENKKNDEKLLSEINRLSNNNNIINNINSNNNDNIQIINKEKKIEELKKEIKILQKTNKMNQNLTLIRNKKILMNIYEIEKIIRMPINYNLRNIINSNQIPISNSYNINNLIIQEFKEIKKYLKEKNENNNRIQNFQFTQIFKNEINLEYNVKDENDENNLFGEIFRENNYNNIEFYINGEKYSLRDNLQLLKGIYKVKLITKKALTNLKGMFHNCEILSIYDELKYLDTREVTDFSDMFNNCSSISNIKPLENWDVSKGIKFSNMFNKCQNLSDISPLGNWNVSNGEDFSNMFSGCAKIYNIKPLENWNLLNCCNLSSIFSCCESLKDITPLQNWNVSNVIIFHGVFEGCKGLSNIEPLRYWNVSGGINFSCMFQECSLLYDLKPISDWNVSNSLTFSNMFKNCRSLSNKKPIEKWNFSKSYDFVGMFSGCSPNLNINSLNNMREDNAIHTTGE